MRNIDNVHAQIDKNREVDLKTFAELVSIPSIAATQEGIEDCCQYICDLMKSVEIEPVVYRKEGFSPIIYAELKSSNPNAKTILFYGHYDVQPIGAIDAWVSPPFEASIRDGRVYGRGTADNKGQLIAHILAIKRVRETNTEIPVNIKLLFEGEEEAGGKHLEEFVPAHKELLKADLCYTADGGMHASGLPNIFFGCRGVAKLQVSLKTCVQDNHSGNKGNLIPNAAWEMVKLLSSLIDENGNCTVEGFYDDVVPPTEYELEQIEAMDYDPEIMAKIFGVKEIKKSKREFYTDLMFRPTFNINGLHSGHTGDGFKTIIPGDAVVRFDMRLVGNQDPDKISNLLAEHIKKVCPDAEVETSEGVWPSSSDCNLPICRTVVQAVGKVYGCKPYVMPRIGATIPEYLFTKVVGIPALTMPYANADENNHAPNENMDVECFYKGIHCTAEVLHEIGNME